MEGLTQQVKRERLKRFLVDVGPFVLIFILGVSYATFQQNNQLTKAIRGASGEQVVGDESSKTLNRLFVYYKQESESSFPYLHQLDGLDILTPESLASKESIRNINEVIKKALSELGSYDQIMARVINGAKQVIQNSELSELQKEEMLAGFLKGINDSESNRLEYARVVAKKIYFEKVKDFYEFMLINFNDYKLQTDNFGNSELFFYEDADVVSSRYTQILIDIQRLADEYAKIDSEFVDYKDKKFKKDGINVTSEEIQNYFK